MIDLGDGVNSEFIGKKFLGLKKTAKNKKTTHFF